MVRDDFTSFRHGVVSEISPMHKIFAQFLLVASWVKNVGNFWSFYLKC